MALISRLGTLHALILAAEMQNYLSIHKHIMNETSVIADTYYGIDNYFIYENTETNHIQKDIVEYVRIVIDREWLFLKEDKRLSNEAWSLYRKIG